MEENVKAATYGRYIKMTNITDLTTFVVNASKVVGDVIVRKGKYVIDGKSLMGLMSIDVSTGATVEYPAEAKEFDIYVQQFETSIQG